MTTSAQPVHDVYFRLIGRLWVCMNALVELRRRTWAAALRLAVVVSILGALIAIAASTVGDVAQAAIVIPVIVVGFAASWVQTGRVHRGATALH
jgi:VIT1/CCC1 family predicted Fe2+/Mn2+ transporter